MHQKHGSLKYNPNMMDPWGQHSCLFFLQKAAEERGDDVTELADPQYENAASSCQLEWSHVLASFQHAVIRIMRFSFKVFQGGNSFIFKDTINVLYEEISLHLLDKPNRGNLTQCRDETCHGVKNKWRASFQQSYIHLEKEKHFQSAYPFSEMFLL